MIKKIIFTIISFWTILFIVGLFVGKMTNDFDDREGVEEYIEKYTVIVETPVSDSSVRLINNLTPSIRKKRLMAKFDAGRYYYRYTENSNENPQRIANINYTASYKKRISFDKLEHLFGIFGIGSSLKSFIFNKNTIKTISTSTLKEKAIAIPIILSGFLLGYFITNNQNFDSDSPIAQSVLNDNVFWENVIKHHKIKNNSPN